MSDPIPKRVKKPATPPEVLVGPSQGTESWNVHVGDAEMAPSWDVQVGEAKLDPPINVEIGRPEFTESALYPQESEALGADSLTPTVDNGFGAIVPGNIDLRRRPHVMNSDGSRSTVRSMGVNFGGNEVLIPTVSDDGHIMTNEDAVLKYELTGKHLGEYPSVDASNAAAEAIHVDQEENMPADTLDAPMSRTVPYQGIPAAGRYSGQFGARK
jgi:hypothetical protein